MSHKLQPPRGTQDLHGEKMKKHQQIIQTAEQLAALFGYEPIATPIFEYTSVFKRTIGETSDIVGKEMYTFCDRGGEEVTLRPEGTAGVIRAVMSEGLTQSMPLKYIYAGPMFRYERPQMGRYRQLHQVGVECLGIENPLSDVETIALGARILEALGLKDRVQLEINTLGDGESRAAYRAALIAYLEPHFADLSPDSQERFHKNPLRILDSKEAKDQAILGDAPRFPDFLTEVSCTHFTHVCRGLEALGIVYVLNDRLVRGLDYYTHTAFEFTTTELGAQATLLAGGRYDGLMAQMGGPQCPGIGWALGIDRLSLMLATPEPTHYPIAVIPVGGEAMQERAFEIAMKLRSAGQMVDMVFSGNVGKRMKRANKVKAKGAILLGEDEWQSACVTVRDLESGNQNIVAINELEAYIKCHFQKN